MTTNPRLSKSDLLDKYPDRTWRSRLLQLSNLTIFLEQCILKADYRIPDDLNESFQLTSYGKDVSQELVTKHDVPPKEARLICLLETVYAEPLVDVDRTKIDDLRSSIAEQVRERSIMHPFIFGRELYDRAATMFKDERRYLSHQDTLKLLDGTAIGVFQIGPDIVGPFGMLTSLQERYLAPTRRVPLYHCNDLTCDGVHTTALTSDNLAPINEHRTKVYKILEKRAPESWDWGEFFQEVAGTELRAYDDQSLASLPYLLGDALADSELRSLVAHLMDNTGGRFREVLSGLGITGAATTATEPLDRSQLMQLAMLESDQTLVDAVDHLVLEHEIDVPPGELRRPVIHRGRASGAFGLQLQLGHFGCRIHSVQKPIGPLRLKRLVDSLYLLEQEEDVSELEWQLRGVDAPTLPARIGEFVRNFTPEEVVRRLVLARKTNMVTACASLRIDQLRDWSDDDLVAAVLWKLDFLPSDDRDGARRFWQLHERMKQLTQTAGVSALVDTEAVRALASNYFVQLEEFLDDSAAFTTWALTTDHMSSNRPFAYRASYASGAFGILNAYEEERESGPETVRYGKERALYELCRSFGSLAGHLHQIKSDSTLHERPDASLPKFATATNLKMFPFRHTMPFLDLLPHSQELVIETLREASRTLIGADVNGVRNDQLHFRRSTADLGRLSECLAAVERAANALEQAGFTRLTFHPVREQGDNWGRRLYTLSDARGREIAIARPSMYDWVLLPGPRRPQYLMTAAVFAEPSEFLRFREDSASAYADYWEGYPVRREHGAATSLPASAADATSLTN